MSFEKIYLSRRGTEEINKITDFLMNLVIKNEYEARKFETAESITDYYKFHGAYTKTDSIEDYDIKELKDSTDDIILYMTNTNILNRLSIHYEVAINIVNLYTNNYNLLKNDLANNNRYAKEIFNGLRISRQSNYKEKNFYYKQFLGEPNTKDSWVYVTNYDKSIDGYTPVDISSGPPAADRIYFTKNEYDQYIQLGFIKSWYKRYFTKKFDEYIPVSEVKLLELLADGFSGRKVVLSEDEKLFGVQPGETYYRVDKIYQNVGELSQFEPGVEYYEFIFNIYAKIQPDEIENGPEDGKEYWIIERIEHVPVPDLIAFQPGQDYSVWVYDEYYYIEDNTYIKLSKDDLIAGPNPDFDNHTVPMSNNFYVFNMVPIHLVTNSEFPKTYLHYMIKNHIKDVINQFPTYTYLRFLNIAPADRMSAYVLRNMPNYSIIRYKKDILNDIELEYFFKSYNKARQQIVMDYIDGFDQKQPLYNLLMLQNLLYYTIINYSSSYIEQFCLGQYTEENIDNILNSHGYSELTKIKNVSLKRKVIKNLNDLIVNKGTNKVINLILDRVIEDRDMKLTRYYIEKEYTTDNRTMAINIDTSQGLENSVSLVMRKVQIQDTTDDIDAVSTVEYVNFDNFVLEDKLWGGFERPNDLSASAVAKRELIKKEILKLNIDSLLTRYIVLTKVVDIVSIQQELRDLIWLMFKFIGESQDTRFFQKKIVYDGVEITPAGLFGAMCWLQQMKFQNTDPDKIILDECVINSSVVFRQAGRSATTLNNPSIPYPTHVDERNSFEDMRIIDGKPTRVFNISPTIANWKVVDFIKENQDAFEDLFIGNDDMRIATVKMSDILRYDYAKRDGKKRLEGSDIEMEDMTDYLAIFRYYPNNESFENLNPDMAIIGPNTNFEDFVEDYMHQYPDLINRINKRISEAYDFREYQAWIFLLEQNRKNNSIAFIFKKKQGDEYHTKFTEFIEDYDSIALIDYIQTRLVPHNPNLYDIPPKSQEGVEPMYNIDSISNMLDGLTQAFQKWVSENISDAIFKLSGGSGSGPSAIDADQARDLKILFNEFLSVYSELYSIERLDSLGGSVDSGGKDNFLQLFYNPVGLHFELEKTDVLEIMYRIYRVLINLDMGEEDIDLIEYVLGEVAQLYELHDVLNNDFEIVDGEVKLKDPLTYQHVENTFDIHKTDTLDFEEGVVSTDINVDRDDLLTFSGHLLVQVINTNTNEIIKEERQHHEN